MHVVEYPVVIAIVVGLVLTWKLHNARWFFILLGILTTVDIVSDPIVKQWTRHYYLWCIFLNFFYLMAILSRGVIAEKLHRATKLRFFELAREKYNLTIPECVLCVLSFVSILLNVSIWIEIQLYYYDILSYPFIYYHLWTPVQYTLHTLAVLALISYIVSVKKSYGVPVNEESRT